MEVIAVRLVGKFQAFSYYNQSLAASVLDSFRVYKFINYRKILQAQFQWLPRAPSIPKCKRNRPEGFEEDIPGPRNDDNQLS